MNLSKTIAVATGILLVSACTTNPYTGEQQASKAATYGAGAAAVCGLVGAIDSGKHARNAALGCGIVGAGVGAYMDVQEAKLREQLQGTGVSVVREGDNIRLVMPGNITFETDSYNLRSSFYPVLNSVGDVLAKYADTTVRVTGHTDNTGSRAYNQTLSVCWCRVPVWTSRLRITELRRDALPIDEWSCIYSPEPPEGQTTRFRRRSRGRSNFRAG